MHRSNHTCPCSTTRAHLKLTEALVIPIVENEAEGHLAILLCEGQRHLFGRNCCLGLCFEEQGGWGLEVGGWREEGGEVGPGFLGFCERGMAEIGGLEDEAEPISCRRFQRGVPT